LPPAGIGIVTDAWLGEDVRYRVTVLSVGFATYVRVTLTNPARNAPIPAIALPMFVSPVVSMLLALPGHGGVGGAPHPCAVGSSAAPGFEFTTTAW